MNNCEHVFVLGLCENKTKTWLQSKICLHSFTYVHSCTTLTVTEEHHSLHTNLSLKLILSNQGCCVQLRLLYPTWAVFIKPRLNHPTIVNPPTLLRSKWPTTVFNHLLFDFSIFLDHLWEASRETLKRAVLLFSSENNPQHDIIQLEIWWLPRLTPRLQKWKVAFIHISM